MARIVLDGIGKRYADGTRAVRDLDLDIRDGEFMILVGPSGCGKSTALRMIAGLEEISEGTLCIDDTVANDLEPRERDVAMVFQSYALYPHMSVRDNMGFSLRLSGVPKGEIERRVREAAELLGIDAYLDRRPANLSGGQRQRVAMGRAIVRQPAVFLMDEPLSNLDAKLRVQTRAELARLQSRLGTTMIYVTHDQTEAMTLGDRVAVLRDGELQQVAPPDELYERPANAFVAGFIGSPAMNLLEAVADDGGELRIAGDVVDAPTSACGAIDAGARYVLGARPEHMRLDASGIPAVVDLVESTGADHYAYVSIDGTDAPVIVRALPSDRVKRGDRVNVAYDAELAHLFDASSELRIGG